MHVHFGKTKYDAYALYLSLINQSPEDCTIDLTEKEIEEYKRVMSEFFEWQDKLEKAMNKE